MQFSIKRGVFSLESIDGKSACTLEYYPTFAKLTLHRIKNPNFTEMSMIIESAYQDLEISIDQFEH